MFRINNLGVAMKLRHVFLLFGLLLAGSTFAGVDEKSVTLPDGLGTGVLYSPDKGRKPTAGVIVIHEWWGLDDYTRGRAQQLAKEGYVALALDMYGHGKVAEHPDKAQEFMQAAMAEPDKMNARFDAAREILEKEKRVDKARIYAIGYCFGGGVVLNQARRGVDIAGVASFHGSLGGSEQPTAEKIKARLLVATGADDPLVPPEQVASFVEEVMQAGAQLELLSFPGVVHSFTNPAATARGAATGMPLAYDRHADTVSWQALLNMLAK